MDFRNFTAQDDDAGRRLDKIARSLLKDHSLGAIYKYIRKGLVRKDGRRVAADTRLAAGDIVNVAAFLLHQDGESSCNHHADHVPLQGLDVPIHNLFWNRHIRIISKPYDIPVQGGGNGGLPLDKVVLQEYLRDHQNSPAALSFRPGPLHRLDRKTTGALAFSQSLAGARWFSSALRHHLILKEYLAVVEGLVEEEHRWNEAVFRQGRPDKKGFYPSQVHEDGKDATTTACPLAWGRFRDQSITLLRLSIGTGRTHQIRLHCSHHGHPLLGDRIYGGRPQGGALEQEFFLHAWKLDIPSDNPLDMPQTITAPLPEKFRKLIADYLPDMDSREYSI